MPQNDSSQSNSSTNDINQQETDTMSQTNVQNSNISHDPVVTDPRLARAKERADAIPIAETESVRLDIHDAATTAIAVMERIETVRSDVARELGDEGTTALDDVIPAARYAILANADHAALSGGTSLEEPAQALTAKRTRFGALMNAMVARKRGLKKPRLTGGQSYAALSEDVTKIGRWFLGNTDKLGDLAKVDPAELQAAIDDAERFARMVKRAEAATSKTTPTGSNRARAYTYFIRVYDRARQMVTFTRWVEGDADAIAPSLFTGRTRRTTDDAPEPVTPVVAAPVAPAPVNPIPPGLPGADPFIRNPQ